VVLSLEERKEAGRLLMEKEEADIRRYQ